MHAGGKNVECKVHIRLFHTKMHTVEKDVEQKVHTIIFFQREMHVQKSHYLYMGSRSDDMTNILFCTTQFPIYNEMQ